MYLRPLFEDSERIIFVDAVVMGREPGTILQMDAEHIISFRSFRPTVHEIGLRDAVNIIKLRKKKLPEIVLVGVEPENLDEGVELSESVKNAVPRVVEQIYGQLKEWGFEIPT
jgi:hydrogenase maturation protease